MGFNKKVLQVVKGEIDNNVVWFMRQAGRYLPDYESMKAGKPFMEVLKDPATIADVSLLPLKYMDVDAIVVFTDILLPYTRLGYRVSYEDGISILKDEGEGFDFYSSLNEGLKRIIDREREKTIIGVIGGPFTTLSYLYDSGRAGYYGTKEKIAGGEENTLRELTEEIIRFAEVQAKAGVDLIQVFDSWIGSVSGSFYDRHLASNELYFMEKIRDLGKPTIFFSEGSSHLYDRLRGLEPDVFSIDWRMELQDFRNICGDCVVQGNLDPYLLNSSDDYLRRETFRIMDQGRKFKGHIFNLGHGVPPWADWRKLSTIEREVHNYER